MILLKHLTRALQLLRNSRGRCNEAFNQKHVLTKDDVSCRLENSINILLDGISLADLLNNNSGSVFSGDKKNEERKELRPLRIIKILLNLEINSQFAFKKMLRWNNCREKREKSIIEITDGMSGGVIIPLVKM